MRASIGSPVSRDHERMASMGNNTTDTPGSAPIRSDRSEAASDSAGESKSRSKRGNIFISKHEKLGKDRAEVVARELRDRGYEVWLSQWQDNKDEAEMQKGVDQCDALVLIMTPGIFERERHWVNESHSNFQHLKKMRV